MLYIPLTEIISHLQPPILMNRFIINLRSLKEPAGPGSTNQDPIGSVMSAPRFNAPASLLGNAGELLVHGDSGAPPVGEEDEYSPRQTGDVEQPVHQAAVELGDVSRRDIDVSELSSRGIAEVRRISRDQRGLSSRL